MVILVSVGVVIAIAILLWENKASSLLISAKLILDGVAILLLPADSNNQSEMLLAVGLIVLSTLTVYIVLGWLPHLEKETK